MTDLAVRVEGLGKRYQLGSQARRYKSLREQLARLPGSILGKAQPSSGSLTHWALRDVSFQVQQGEVVGIIGRNGAGKSTLLKLLSRITEPTTGQAYMHGRVGSLLEVGTGFHPELSGRENVYLNGAILGMKKQEIDRKFDEIVAFADLEPFLDTPVKRYSSGMYVRLAFAVSAHLETEILVVDEVLAVGDSAFQKKCTGKMREVGRAGRTVFFVSHNMGAVSELCSRGMLLNEGKIISDGSVAGALETYSRFVHESVSGAIATLDPDDGLPCSILEVSVRNNRGHLAGRFDINDEIVVTLKYEIRKPLKGLSFDVQLSRNMTDLFHSYDTDDQDEIGPRCPGIYQAEHLLPPRFLKAGSYTVTVGSGTSHISYQVFSDLLSFEVVELSEATHSKGYRTDRAGHVISPGRWQTEKLADLPLPE